VIEHYEEDFPNRILKEFRKDYGGGFLPHMINIEARMYKITGDEAYAHRASEIVSRFLSGGYVAQNGNMGSFNLGQVLGGYNILREGGFLSPEDQKFMDQLTINFAEQCLTVKPRGGGRDAWNHIVIDAAVVIDIAQTFKDHPNAGKWLEWAQVIMEQSFNKPPCEDSTNYTPIWFLYTLRAAELLGKTPEFYTWPYTKYYFQYLRDLIAPTGRLPDTGDTGTMGADWFMLLPTLERGAAVYRDGTYKKAAHMLFQFISQYTPVFGGDLGYTPSKELIDLHEGIAKEFIDKGGWYASVADSKPLRPERVINLRADAAVRFASYFILSYLWADDTVQEEPIPERSVLYERRALLKDTRDGEDSYMLLGLEDWTTVHGQAEGNAINFLCHGGSTLLDESGYTGFWHARYHNTVLWKEGVSDKPFDYAWETPGSMIFTSSRPPQKRAQVPIFKETENITVARSVLEPFQRTVVRGKRCYYVFDYLNVKGPQTAACLYHTEKIAEEGSNSLRTRIDLMLNGSGYFSKACNPPNMDLALIFPSAKLIGSRKEIRADSDQIVVYQALSGEFPQGIAFSSVLYPVRRYEPYLGVAATTKALETTAYPLTDGLRMSIDGEDLYVCNKNSSSVDMARYGDIETDADILYLRAGAGKLSFSAINVSKIKYKDKTILSAEKKRDVFETIIE
jgi:hypothetical protein